MSAADAEADADDESPERSLRRSERAGDLDRRRAVAVDMWSDRADLYDAGRCEYCLPAPTVAFSRAAAITFSSNVITRFSFPSFSPSTESLRRTRSPLRERERERESRRLLFRSLDRDGDGEGDDRFDLDDRDESLSRERSRE